MPASSPPPASDTAADAGTWIRHCSSTRHHRQVPALRAALPGTNRRHLLDVSGQPQPRSFLLGFDERERRAAGQTGVIGPNRCGLCRWRLVRRLWCARPVGETRPGTERGHKSVGRSTFRQDSPAGEEVPWAAGRVRAAPGDLPPYTGGPLPLMKATATKTRAVLRRPTSGGATAQDGLDLAEDLGVHTQDAASAAGVSGR